MMLNTPERVVVDTSVVSILFRGHHDNRYEYYNQRIGESLKIVSFQTLEELWFGAYLRNWGSNRISAFAEHLSAYRVIYPNRRLIGISANLRSDTRKLGRELTSADAWIAATAVMMDCPLATDDRDFDAVSNRLALIRRLG